MENIRNEFILSDKRIFLNNASQGPSPRSVIETIKNSIDAIETTGESGREQVGDARKKIADFLNVDAKTIALTGNTTEGINMIAHSLPLQKGDEIIISKHEHVGGSAPWYAIRESKGVSVKCIDLDLNGERILELIEECISDKTKVISISHVLCTTGLRLPVKEIAALCRRKNIYSCIDGAQSLGMFPIDLKDINADFYAASGHKWLYGPKGSGILYINEKLIPELVPPFTGAHSLETFDLSDTFLNYSETAERFESGTQNTSAILGIASAVDFIEKVGFENIKSHTIELSELLLERLHKMNGITVLSSAKATSSSSIITFRPDNKDYQEFNRLLRKDYRCRCRAVHENGLNGIRVSLALYNNRSEIEKLADGIQQLAK